LPKSFSDSSLLLLLLLLSLSLSLELPEELLLTWKKGICDKMLCRNTKPWNKSYAHGFEAGLLSSSLLSCLVRFVSLLFEIKVKIFFSRALKGNHVAKPH